MHKKTFEYSAPIKDVRLLDKPVTIGTETYAPGRDKFYFEFTLLHSYPAINANGATFAYPLLKRFIPTAVNSPIDIEHEIEGSPLFQGENKIVGAIIAADVPELEDDELLPPSAQPVTCIGVLWGRLSEVQKIVDEMQNGVDWKISMEVDRDLDQDVFFVGDQIITQSDEAWDAVYGAWIQGKEYASHKVGLGLGGTGLEKDDYANFFGAGIVMQPADEEAVIHSLTMAPAATKGKDPRSFIGIAVDLNRSVAADTPKVAITSNGDLESTVLQIAGTEISDFNVLNFSVDDVGDGYPYFNVSWSKYETGDDGITQITHWYYDPMIGSVVQGKRNGGNMDLKELKQMIAESEAKFEGYKSPDEFDQAVADVKAEYEGYLSPEQVEAKIAEAQENAVEQFRQTEAVYADRESALTEAGLEITEDRKTKLRAFATDEDGNKDFDQWVDSLKTGQSEMEAVLKENEIEVNDKVKRQIASLDGKDDPRFKTAIALNLGQHDRTVVIPGSGGNGVQVDYSAI